MTQIPNFIFIPKLIALLWFLYEGLHVIILLQLYTVPTKLFLSYLLFSGRKSLCNRQDYSFLLFWFIHDEIKFLCSIISGVYTTQILDFPCIINENDTKYIWHIWTINWYKNLYLKEQFIQKLYHTLCQILFYSLEGWYLDGIT